VKVLCVNAGSSSLKSSVYEDDRLLASTTVDADDVASALGDVLDQIDGRRLPEPDAVGHRIVHGGPKHTQHAVLDEDVLDDLRAAVRFAPLHLPASLQAVGQITARLGSDVPQVACFDTAFHRDLPDVAQRYPLPDWVHDAGVRRYGFHGLSCEYVVDHLGAELRRRAVVAHLGSGASCTALRDGRSVDTTMGLTPTGGIVMATRTGDLDPGVLLHLARHHGLDPDGLEHLVDHEGGLQGLAGSHDMAALLAVEADDPAAARAVDAFCYRARQAIGALTATLGGLDTLVFAGGIGEHAPIIRSRVCAGLEHLDVALDPAANGRGDVVVSTGRVAVRVVATDENRMIARHTARLVRGLSPPG
jgi:acetate kinase